MTVCVTLDLENLEVKKERIIRLLLNCFIQFGRSVEKWKAGEGDLAFFLLLLVKWK